MGKGIAVGENFRTLSDVFSKQLLIIKCFACFVFVFMGKGDDIDKRMTANGFGII